MVLITNKKEQVRGKTVLLFSSGMDCLCLNQIFHPDIILHINYGGKYGKREKESLNELMKCGAIDKNKVIEYNIGEWLGERERDDLIIPNRNAYFVLLASELGEVIYLASVKGDRSLDKDLLFYNQMTELLNHMWDSQHWTEKRVFNVTSPIKHLTKYQLIKLFLKNRGKKEWLLKSYSCYRGKRKPCGECKPCIRKAIALKLNNIKYPLNYFIKNPKQNKELISLKEKIIKGDYRGDEDKDICKFMGWKYIGK